jgi:hypothetical protein
VFRNVWFVAAIAPVLIELLITWLRPEWLTTLPSWRVTESSFTLRNPKRLVTQGYRDASRLAPLPELMERAEFTGAVMRARGGRIVLRRAFDVGRRVIWVVAIDIERTSETVTLRARQLLTPITLLVSAPLYAMAITHRLSLVWTLGALTLITGVHGFHTLLSRKARNLALDEAFRFLEDTLRPRLEET